MSKNNHKRKNDQKHGEEMSLIRLDQLLFQLGFAQSRDRAKELIKKGCVTVDGRLAKKAAEKHSAEAKVELSGEDIPWVSRAALKLEKAFDEWDIKVSDTVCLDIGASTGGFTEVLLHGGARKVYALDVGHDQLARKLREDSRVAVMENTNIREVSENTFPVLFDIITVDVSFISLEHVFPKVSKLLAEKGEAIVLIKPQFEVGKKYIQKGIVRDPDLHQKVIEKIKKLAESEGLKVSGLTNSPITGKKGNREFIIHLIK